MMENKGMTKKKPISRSAAGLGDALFEQLERIRDGEVDKGQAESFVKTTDMILKFARLQMEHDQMKHQDLLPKTSDNLALPKPDGDAD